MRVFWFLLFAAGLSAQDASLESLRATLSGPELTAAKHQLRDWIESRLANFDSTGDEQALAREMNAALEGARLANPEDRVGEVRISFQDRNVLMVGTSLGIAGCGVDASAYVYLWKDNRWQRIWESEQDDSSTNKYKPQGIEAVHVWAAWRSNEYWIMTLGTAHGCNGTTGAVYYRVWNVDVSSRSSRLKVEGEEFARVVADHDPAIIGSIGGKVLEPEAPVNAWIEYTTIGSLDDREIIRHYQFEGDQVRRVDPVALSPRDFADEWLLRPWDESGSWSNSDSLRKWHNEGGGLFNGPSMHCETPDLWQVTLDRGKDFDQPTYFLVRWRPPYKFTMMEVGDKPWPNCNEPDPQADEWRTLFPIQRWMRWVVR